MEFSQRDVPWMKAGVDLVERPVTAAEAAELGGLNFNVELWPTKATPPDDSRFKGTEIVHEDRFSVIRTDTLQPLSVVGSHYEVLNFADAFDFMDTVSPTYVAAGVRRGGREGYLVAQAPEHLRMDLVNGEDQHDLYVVLRASHDGSKQVEVSVLPLRNKCTNMMSLQGFARGARHRWGIRHTSTMHEKLAEAQESLQRIDDYVADLRETSQMLAEIDLEIDEVRKLIRWALPNRPKRDENVVEIMNIYETSPSNGYVGNGWGVVNALSEWMDWGRTSKSQDARFINGLSGFSHKTVNRVAARLLTRGR